MIIQETHADKVASRTVDFNQNRMKGIFYLNLKTTGKKKYFLNEIMFKKRVEFSEHKGQRIVRLKAVITRFQNTAQSRSKEHCVTASYTCDKISFRSLRQRNAT